jgi:hypothetical protein
MDLLSLVPLIKIVISISTKTKFIPVIKIKVEIITVWIFQPIKTINKGQIISRILAVGNNSKWIVMIQLLEIFFSNLFTKIKMILLIRLKTSSKILVKSRKLSMHFLMAIQIKLKRLFLKSWVWKIPKTICI